MAKVIWAEPALFDLNEIAEYIALDKQNAAQKLVQSVFSTAARLEEFPNSGRRIPELRKSTYREVVVGPCRVFYRVDGELVYILHVMRSERLLRKYVLDERAVKSS